MRNAKINIKFSKGIGVGVLVILLITATWLSIITHKYKNVSTANNLLRFAINNHTIILVSLIVIAIASGFLWSNILYSEIKKKQKDTKTILNVVLQFLNNEEKAIIKLLVENNGSTTQSEIARLPNMTRVKAFRSLQKMEEKALIEIIPHGKIRKVKVKENILDSLLESNE